MFRKKRLVTVGTLDCRDVEVKPDEMEKLGEEKDEEDEEDD